MKRTIISAIVVIAIFSTFFLIQENATAENSVKAGMQIISNAPNSGGSISGPVVRNFITDGNGHGFLADPVPPAGYYCICVSGQGGGCLGSVYFNGLYGSFTVDNGATCICGD